jgi:hypothetical protein
VAELKIYLSKDLNEKFRRMAMSIYGYGRGSISRAAEDALAKWCEGREPTTLIESDSTNTKGKQVVDGVEAGINPDERVSNSKPVENKSTKDNSAFNNPS